MAIHYLRWKFLAQLVYLGIETDQPKWGSGVQLQGGDREFVFQGLEVGWGLGQANDHHLVSVGLEQPGLGDGIPGCGVVPADVDDLVNSNGRCWSWVVSLGSWW
jgi:hypothetical protein